MFDQKAHYELGDHRVDSLLKPECLSSYNLPNEMSYAPSDENSCIFNFNSFKDNEESFSEEEVEVENVLSSGKKFGTNTVEFGLRVESQRAGYASKYLFAKTTGPTNEIDEEDDDESYDNEESYASADYSCTNITEANFSVAVASPDSSVEPINQIQMHKYASAMNPTTDLLATNESHDMFFSCCDWESAMVQESRCKLNNQEPHHFHTEPKRVRKMNDKELACSSFDQ